MRDITEDEVRQYRDHGVVCLRGLLDDDWLQRMEAAYTEEMFTEAPGVNHGDIGQVAQMISQGGGELLAPEAGAKPPAGRFTVRTFNWRQFPAVADLALRTRMPQTIAKLMGSTRLNFYGEQLFYKEAGSIHRTAFHQDAPYFHLSGEQCCTIWMPLDQVDADNGMMGYVRGSHRWDIHAANTFASQQPIPGSTFTPLPDIEGNESDFDIVYYPVEPGDAIVHHVRTVHGSTGNTGTRDRRAFTLRYLGDDIRYLKRQGAPPDSQASATLQDGDVMDSAEFPLIWTTEQGLVPA